MKLIKIIIISTIVLTAIRLIVNAFYELDTISILYGILSVLVVSIIQEKINKN